MLIGFITTFCDVIIITTLFTDNDVPITVHMATKVKFFSPNQNKKWKLLNLSACPETVWTWHLLRSGLVGNVFSLFLSFNTTHDSLTNLRCLLLSVAKLFPYLIG